MTRNKYIYFASKIRKEGPEQIMAIFEEAVGNEEGHAKLWFKELNDIGGITVNLEAVVVGESEEWTQMCKGMIETAHEEGLEELTFLFDSVGETGKEHEECCLTLLRGLEEGVVFKRGGEYVWRCRDCGHVHSGKITPEVCPIYAHPQAHLEIRNTNY